ncbi:MAG: hypothetical protein EAZ30_00675 [Betaproteobacteria bacterium]|nr:MAG: hypothetical protein EAZ30_00675 [Betaproteobacteria bacterium]
MFFILLTKSKKLAKEKAAAPPRISPANIPTGPANSNKTGTMIAKAIKMKATANAPFPFRGRHRKRIPKYAKQPRTQEFDRRYGANLNLAPIHRAPVLFVPAFNASRLTTVPLLVVSSYLGLFT